MSDQTLPITDLVDRLVRARDLIALFQSVDWDSPMVGAENGSGYLLDEVRESIGYVIKNMTYGEEAKA